jgi:hypothetical protein
MASSNCLAGRGKKAQCSLWARHGFYRRGSLKKLARVWESLVGVELVLEHREFLLKGGAVIGGGSISPVRPEDKMATGSQNGNIITLLKRIKLGINNRGKLENSQICGN